MRTLLLWCSVTEMLQNSHKTACSSRAVCHRAAPIRKSRSGGATRQRQLCVVNLHKALRQVWYNELWTRSVEASGTQGV